MLEAVTSTFVGSKVHSKILEVGITLELATSKNAKTFKRDNVVKNQHVTE